MGIVRSTTCTHQLLIPSNKQGEVHEWQTGQGEKAGTFRVHGQEHNTSKGLPCLNLAGYLEGQLHRNQVAGIPCTNAAMCHLPCFIILSKLISEMQHDMDVPNPDFEHSNHSNVTRLHPSLNATCPLVLLSNLPTRLLQTQDKLQRSGRNVCNRTVSKQVTPGPKGGLA